MINLQEKVLTYKDESPFEYEYLRFFYKKYRKIQMETGEQF